MISTGLLFLFPSNRGKEPSTNSQVTVVILQKGDDNDEWPKPQTLLGNCSDLGQGICYIHNTTQHN